MGLSQRALVYMSETPELGIISRNPQVRDWVLKTPKCPMCNFFVTCQFSGLRNEFVWPVCSNAACVLSRHTHTFIRPEVENEE